MTATPPLSLHVLASVDLVRCVVAFQPGLPLDLLPFAQWIALTPLLHPRLQHQPHMQRLDMLLETLDRLLPRWTPPLSAWYASFDPAASRVPVFCHHLPHLVPILAWEAVASGRGDVLTYLHTHHLLTTEGAPYFSDVAAAHGHVPLLLVLDSHGFAPCTTSAADRAAEKGHLEVVQYVYKRTDDRRRLPSSCAINYAAQHGHIQIVRWLHAQDASCSTFALDWAAKGGHFDTVKFLHTHRREGCTTQAMDWAATNGHLAVVAFLHRHRSEGCTRMALVRAAERGHVPVVDYLVRHRDLLFVDAERVVQSAREAAVRVDQMDVAAYFDQLDQQSSAQS
ncbi:Aste57867_18431 [Aphanomyces stellatus]|uniref:Aste57867_18431 protein n=1 Tax=Aphanomyces stellatus TaxID=120398 RepID=A0A485LA32_9STRA|nr:hypothetical protein As57867_018369 [Aphanomyces stellatus]VFT95167.1 Aste57867_18431 [Aphanomyces stellatus]